MFVFFQQARNNKKTAILVKEVNTKKRLFLVYRPNTGRQLKLETYADIKKKFKKVTQCFHYSVIPVGKKGFVIISIFISSLAGLVRRSEAALD